MMALPSLERTTKRWDDVLQFSVVEKLLMLESS
jgi:hypothetical protein